jgi:hypothetical protein
VALQQDQHEPGGDQNEAGNDAGQRIEGAQPNKAPVFDPQGADRECRDEGCDRSFQQNSDRHRHPKKRRGAAADGRREHPLVSG